MGYSKAKGRSKGQYIMLRFDMAKSDAWKSLSANARCVWLEVMHRYNGNNNGEIPLSCREAGERCNFSKNTASKALKELQERGFVEATIASSFNYKDKFSTRWRVTHESFNGKRPTNEWRKWKE